MPSSAMLTIISMYGLHTVYVFVSAVCIVLITYFTRPVYILYY